MRAIAAAYVELNDPATAQTLLEKSLTAAEAIESDWYKSSALQAIAAAYLELKDPLTAQTLLEKSLIAAEAIESDGQMASRVSSIITTIDTLNEQVLRQDLLGTVLTTARNAEASVPMVEIATLYAQQQQWGKALAALQGSRESEKIVGLTRIFTAEAETEDLRFIEGAIVLPMGEKGAIVIDDADPPTFEVMVQSPDEDCEHYADWVEVLTPDGDLKGRVVFNQPHLDEPTFTASLTASNPIQSDEAIIIRAHFYGTYASGENPLVDSVFRERFSDEGRYERSGYTDQALQGTMADGFESVRLSANYAQWLEDEEPLPEWEMCKEE